MTSDPKRLLEPGGDATDAECDLLRSAGDVEPPPDARAATWAALATRLPPIGGSGAPPGPSGGTGTGGAGTAAVATGTSVGAKALGVALVGSLLVLGAWATLRSPVPTSSPAAPPSASSIALPATASETPPALTAPENLAPDPPVGPPPATAAVSTGSGKPHPPHGAAQSAAVSSGSATSAVDALREESALVAAARAAMRRGDGTAALDSLAIARARFPKGTLLQEREVLTIEALAQSGNASAASHRASAFLKAFPTSPHVAHVRTFVQ